MAFFEKDFLDFFIELAGNNHKDWFDANRKRYEKSVKDPFKVFVQHMVDLIAKEDKRFVGLEAKDCIFRINRDIRFSKDKTPYKTYLSAVISPKGKKSDSVHGIYFEFGPEHLRAYGGIYEIDKEKIERIREAIASDIKGFQKLYQAKEFKDLFGEVLGEKNKIIAKDVKKAAEEEPLIYNKQWYFYTQFEPEVLMSEDLDQVILKCFRVGKPIEDYFNKIIHRI